MICIVKAKISLFCENDKPAAESYCAIHGVDKSLNIGDITTANEKEVPDFNTMFGGSPCFPAGTHVLTKHGYKNIEDIRIGEDVYTKEHHWKSVVNIGSDGLKDICKITATGILPIECTLNHPFWIKQKEKKWDNSLRRYKNIISKPIKIIADNLRIGDYLGVPIILDKYNDLQNISHETLWLLGRYVADGFLSEDKGVTLSIGNDKISDFNQVSVPYKQYKHTQSCYRVVFNKSSELFNILMKYDFGKLAINKNIPVEILELPPEKLKYFLDGYWSGDGCRIKDTFTYQATTISRRLAESLVLAIQKVYKTGCKIYFTKRPHQYNIQGRIVNQHDTYLIRFLKRNENPHFIVEDDIIWYPIRKIEKNTDKKIIYNIEVEHDHTYIANGAIVFNCQDFSVAGKQKGATWTCESCGHEYNPLEAHFTTRDICPVCGSADITKTRSSLLVEWLRFLREKKPRFAIYENVKNITGKKFKVTFDYYRAAHS